MSRSQCVVVGLKVGVVLHGFDVLLCGVQGLDTILLNHVKNFLHRIRMSLVIHLHIVFGIPWRCKQIGDVLAHVGGSRNHIGCGTLDEILHRIVVSHQRTKGELCLGILVDPRSLTCLDGITHDPLVCELVHTQPHPPKRSDPPLLVLVKDGHGLDELTTHGEHDGTDILHVDLCGTGVGQAGIVHGLHTHEGVGHGVGWDGGNRMSGHRVPFVS